MSVLFTNNASTLLASAITSAQTTLVVTTGEGALFPSPSGSDYFVIVVEDSSANLEIMKCTGRAGDTLTIERAFDNSTAKAFSAGARVELRPTAHQLEQMLQLVGGVLTGDLSGITPTSAAHLTRKDYVDTADGLKFDKAGGTVTGDITVAKATPQVILNRNSGAGNCNYALQVSGTLRALLQFDVTSTLLNLILYDTDGSTVLGSLAIDANGQITNSQNNPTASKHLVTKDYVDGEITTLTGIMNAIYDISGGVEGAVAASSEIFTFVAARDFDIANGAIYGSVRDTNPSTNVVVSVKVNGTEIGTLTITTAGAFTFAQGGSYATITAGDVLTFNSPADVYGLDTPYWTIKGTIA